MNELTASERPRDEKKNNNKNEQRTKKGERHGQTEAENAEEGDGAPSRMKREGREAW